jgi:hypothetical protein
MIILFCWLFLNYLLMENWKSGINGERGVANNILDKLRARMHVPKMVKNG